MIKIADQQRIIQKIKDGLGNLIAQLEQDKKLSLTPEQENLWKEITYNSATGQMPSIRKFAWKKEDNKTNDGFLCALEDALDKIKYFVKKAELSLEDLSSNVRISLQWGGVKQSLENSRLQRCKTGLGGCIFELEQALDQEQQKILHFQENSVDEKIIELCQKIIDVLDRLKQNKPEFVKLKMEIEKHITSYSIGLSGIMHDNIGSKKIDKKTAKNFTEMLSLAQENDSNERTKFRENIKKNYGSFEYSGLSKENTITSKHLTDFFADSDSDEDGKDTVRLIERNNSNNGKSN